MNIYIVIQRNGTLIAIVSVDKRRCLHGPNFIGVRNELFALEVWHGDNVEFDLIQQESIFGINCLANCFVYYLVDDDTDPTWEIRLE